ncbi:MAG: hypothetical protein OXH96_08870 [Spirochaetaceae bacterium]|nr:hypothetical protein [Spirochaetaceae bacterium]
MTTDDKAMCQIWTSSRAVYSPGNAAGVVRIESSRAGGPYRITEAAWAQLGNLSEAESARLTTLLVDRRIQGENEPIVTPYLVDRALRMESLEVAERADRLLRFVARCLRHPGDTVNLRIQNQDPDTLNLSLAWTESTTIDEVRYFRDYLVRNGWLLKSVGHHYSVSIEGYGRIADVKGHPDATQAFVAMWFDGIMETVYENGIAPAIKRAGFKPMRIDKKGDVVKIDDEIIAEIRRSRFMVADFTHGNEGARGGVYFEAGFALGLGLPVIYTCRADMVDKIHFDTRQYFHTVWEGPDDLQVNLTNRIVALLGTGPNRPPS